MFGLNRGSTPEVENAIDAQLGAFSPPPDFDHGPEFKSACPRPIPIEFHRSRYVRARNAGVWIPALIGAGCFATDLLPFVKQLSWYLLPLGFLKWIGAACLAFAAFVWLRNRFSSGYLQTVEDCQPLIGRARQVYLRDYWSSQIAQNFSRTHFLIAADVEYCDPDSGEIVRREIIGPEYFQCRYLNQLDPGVKPGDYVTLVYYPHRLAKSLQLYGWLGVNPEVDFIRKSGKPLQPMTPLKALLVIIGLMGMTWFLLGLVYVLGRYMPFDDGEEPSLLLVIPLVLSAILTAIGAVCWVKRSDSDQPKSFNRYAFAVFSGTLTGFAFSMFAMMLVNGAFDTGPTHLVPIRVVQFWHQTVYQLGVRWYELEFESYPKGKRTKKTVAIEMLQSFQPDSLGVLDVGQGSLGIPWIRDIRPVIWEESDSAATDPDHGAITFQQVNSLQRMTIAPFVIMADGSRISPPDVLLPELRQRMTHYLQNDLHAKIVD